MQNVIFEMDESLSESGKTQYQKYQKYLDTLSATFAKTMGSHDPSLLVHSRQVAVLAEKLAIRLRLNEQQVNLLRHAGLFHDIGKLSISQTLLSKSSSLSLTEHAMIKKHPEAGALLIQECPEFEMIVPFIRHHHEAYNGKGYPAGLAGEQIPTGARIIAVAEAIDSMLSEHPYRNAFSVQQVIEELKRCSGTQYDPIVVEAAIGILQENEIN